MDESPHCYTDFMPFGAAAQKAMCDGQIYCLTYIEDYCKVKSLLNDSGAKNGCCRVSALGWTDMTYILNIAFGSRIGVSPEL